MQAAKIRIGTRGSPLALAQAREVRARLVAAHGLSEEACELVVIKTSGDQILDRPLAEEGGKGLFTKEIEEALGAGKIDLAVHSMKDMPTELPGGLAIGAILPREDPRDAFISVKHPTLAELPAGALVGTSSLRRQAQVLHMRPDLKVAALRGNVETRLRKLEEGLADATFLACAGLNRLGLAQHVTAPMPTDVMLPGGGAGSGWNRDPQRRRGDRAAYRPLERCKDGAVRCSRARLLGQARGLLPHADRGLGRAARRSAALSRRDPVAGRSPPPRDGTQWRSASRSAARRGGGDRAAGARGARRLPRDRLMRLLITRPEPDAAPLKARLEALGHEVSVEPLLRIELLPIAAAGLQGAQAILATSRNALRALAASEGLAAARASPIFTVGPATTELARELGFERVIAGAGAAADLVPVIVANTAALDGDLVHVAGETLSFDLAGALAGQGYKVRTVPAYRAVPAPSLTAPTMQRIADGTIDAVILMSPRTAEIFVQLVGNAGLEQSARRITCLCLSQAVAEALGDLAPSRTEIATAPNSAAMLAAVARVATLSTGV